VTLFFGFLAFCFSYVDFFGKKGVKSHLVHLCLILLVISVSVVVKAYLGGL
jgi:hypothetical protein